MPTNPPNNPLADNSVWNWVADSYLDGAMPFLSLFAQYAIERAGLTSNMRILDVATGPGTLACEAAPLVARVDGVDFASEMIARCAHRISQLGLNNVFVQEADGQCLPFEDANFDVSFSNFGLMFFPDRVQGFREMVRVLKPGGKAFVTSWAPISESPLMMARVAAQRVASPNAVPPQRNLMTLEDPEVFRSEMTQAGFARVELTPVVRDYTFRDFEHLFAGITRGSAPFELLKRNAGEADWALQLDKMRHHLAATYRNFPVSLSSTAWLGCGVKQR